MNAPIQIAFAADDNYAQHLAVSIASLLVNAKTPGPLCISILHDRMDKDHRGKITRLAALRPQSEIRFISVQATDFSDFPLHTKLHSIATYYRLKLPELLPDADKVLYLDSDIAVMGDISHFWNDDLGSLLLKAVEEPHSINTARQPRFGMKAESPYFNAGVLSLNLALMREQGFSHKAAAVVNQHADALLYQDQDVLNLLAEGCWAPLPLPYNSFFYIFIGIYARDFHYYGAEDIKAARQAPFIIHFNQHPKPWAEGCIDPRRAEYFRYIEMTPYRGFKVNPIKSLWPALVEKYKAATVSLSIKSPQLYLVLRSLKRGLKACQPSRKP